jgi:2-oxo-4-hydroxy-4-carboxy--5-ureidoimidazoline (OHCU) decarboxylase
VTDPFPTIAELDALRPADCQAALAPLFEGTPRFLARLCADRPFGDAGRLFERARAIAHAMPVDERLELIDAHPRLGAAPATVSSLSFAEQGYARDRAGPGVGGGDDDGRVEQELERLNAAYESRFGFRYCVFVAGRPRSTLLPGFEVALGRERDAEIVRAIDAVVDIAADRWRKARGTGG